MNTIFKPRSAARSHYRYTAFTDEDGTARFRIEALRWDGKVLKEVGSPTFVYTESIGKTEFYFVAIAEAAPAPHWLTITLVAALGLCVAAGLWGVKVHRQVDVIARQE